MTRMRKVLTLVGGPVVVVGGLVAIKQSFFTDRHAQVIQLIKRIVLYLDMLFGVKIEDHINLCPIFSEWMPMFN